MRKSTENSERFPRNITLSVKEPSTTSPTMANIPSIATLPGTSKVYRQITVKQFQIDPADPTRHIIHTGAFIPAHRDHDHLSVTSEHVVAAPQPRTAEHRVCWVELSAILAQDLFMIFNPTDMEIGNLYPDPGHCVICYAGKTKGERRLIAKALCDLATLI